MAAMSMQELADSFGVAYTAVWKWSRKPGFPPSLGYRVDRRPSGRPPRGPLPETWDSRAVVRWKRDRKHGNTRRPDSRRATGEKRRLERERERRSLVRKIRSRVSAGATRRRVAVDLEVSYSFVRRVAADIPVPKRPRRRIYSDRELLRAIAVSHAHSSYQYERWYPTQPARAPSLQTIIKRFDSWAAAVAAARSIT